MIRTLLLKHLPGAREGERGESKGDVRGKRLPEEQWKRVGMSGSLRGGVVRIDDSIEYFLPTWELKSPRMKRFLEERRTDGEKESVLLSIEEERIGGA